MLMEDIKAPDFVLADKQSKRFVGTFKFHEFELVITKLNDYRGYTIEITCIT